MEVLYCSFMQVRFVFLLISLLAIACSSPKKAQNESLNNSQQAQQKNKPRIAFVDYELQRSENKIQVSLINVKVVEGTFKQKRKKQQEIENPYFQLLQLDKDDNILETKKLVNPFESDIEFVTENGDLDKKHVVQTKGTISERLQLKRNTQFIVLQRLEAANETVISKEKI